MNPLSQQRKIIIIGCMLLIASACVVKLFSIQVVDKSYKEAAERNAIREVTITPPRGLIYDRNDSLLVYNEAAYDLMVIPKDVKPFDTMDLCRSIDEQHTFTVGGIQRCHRTDNSTCAPVVANRRKVEPIGQMGGETVRIAQALFEPALEERAGMKEAEALEEPVANG